MASSRPMRKSSRMSSPMDTMTKGYVTAKKDTKVVKEEHSRPSVWEEPPLRNPAPSFEDYKGLERQGVLEHMAPLGALPNQKVKLRLKTYDQPRRLPQARNGEVTVTKEEPSPPDSTPPVVAKKSDSRKMEERQTRLQSSRDKDDDQDYTPKLGLKTTPVKQPLLPGTPISRSSVSQAKLRQVVDTAVERANQLGNRVLGLAVRKLYDESLHNRTLAELLDAVLGQRPTERQAADFQGYIRAARKQIKAHRNSTRKVSKSTSKSPSKSARPSSAVNHNETTKESSNAAGLNHSYPKNSASLHLFATEMKREGNGNVAKEDRPAKRRKHSNSASSVSSLSSLPSMDEDFAPPTVTDQASTARVHPPVPPMTNITAQALLGPKHSLYATKNSTSSNKRPISSSLDESAEEDNAKRRKLQKTFDDYAVQESEIRTAPVAKKQSLISFPPNPPHPVNLLTQQPRLRNGTGQKGKKDDYDDLQSPGSSAQSELLIPPPAGAQSSSRGATPNQISRPLKQVRKAARIKMSPMKKRTGVIAGIGDAATAGNADEKEEDVNADQCSACSGNGKLLCCDGCIRSFHFSCLDPPMDPTRPPDGEWYCYKCLAKKDPRPKALSGGVFCSLMNKIDEKNPSSYHLPYDVRDFFEGVKTGEEGEYEDSFATKVKTRAGYEEIQNNLKLQAGPNNATILCYHCGKSSLGQREIVSCDYCDLHWHLDCLDPPLATAPRKIANGKGKSGWMCPNHIDSELQNLRGMSTASGTAQPVTGRAYKVRRPKNPLIRDVAIRRGFLNNGLIEVLNESESDSEKIVSGVIYRLPENGIKLDFISRVKRANAEVEGEQPGPGLQPLGARKWREAAKAQAKAKAGAASSTTLKGSLENRPFVDCQAALSLTQFSQANTDLNLSSDQVENLVGTLIAEAPTEVAALFRNNSYKENSAPSESSAPQQPGLPTTEKKTLELLQELIRRRLAEPEDSKAP